MTTSSKPLNKKPSPLSILWQELKDAEQDAPISVRQARVLIASLINLQNVVVNVMDVMDANQAVANKNNQNISQNFLDLFNCCKVIGESVGIEIQGVNEEAVDNLDETVPDNVTKH